MKKQRKLILNFTQIRCSGDGTLRKSPDLWRRWTRRMGAGMHPLQAGIAWRAAELLRTGGYMSYSTCSMNPLENEAVVADLLRRSRGALLLVDLHEMPDLHNLTSPSPAPAVYSEEAQGTQETEASLAEAQGIQEAIRGLWNLRHACNKSPI
jgi:16S rRNA C967 or C1407 C5-methylase (RsmB/RsmF family)